MSRKERYRKSGNQDEKSIKTIILITAVTNLITALVNLISKLNE